MLGCDGGKLRRGERARGVPEIWGKRRGAERGAGSGRRPGARGRKALGERGKTWIKDAIPMKTLDLEGRESGNYYLAKKH